ncbi:hypothetical protein [Cellulosimicrobium cellulans]|uniref:Uncharacterized protein n=1 Tax=Cellulosimicrobium cellulans TaxID=1710 RepID=A0A4Y4E4P9_CELCE|nr:hypothetical protein [Cellulosimicrobium cellulans]GED11957.1 hypothetical protein CCE02nite_39560 [Cellulosimicrobium cellulans]
MSDIGGLIVAVGQVEASQPGLVPVTRSLELVAGGLRVQTVGGTSVDLLLGQSLDAVWTALAPNISGLNPINPMAQVGGFTPWSRRLGWANYLIDLGTWEEMLRDFEEPLAYERIRWNEDTLHVGITNGARAEEFTRPLDGTGFTGATPAELAADFLRPPI